jgi:cell division septation protein DedD
MMSSGIKRGLFFVSICIVAMLLLYVIWPAKVFHYLTTPARTENGVSESDVYAGSTESAAIVIRKKIPGRLQEVEASYDTNKPVVITKKVPPQKPAPKRESRTEPVDAPSPVPSTVSMEKKETPSVRVSNATAPEAQMTGKPLPAALPSEAKEETAASEETRAVAVAGTGEALDRQPGATPTGASAATGEDRNIVPRPYSIMLASCRRLDSAQTVIKRNRRRGLLPYAVRVNLGQKGIWWRVFEGSYASADEAVDVRRQYQLSGAMVKKTPFAVSIGNFSSETEAAIEVQRLLKLKHSPYFLPGSQNRVRLLVGAFASKNGARQLQDELNARGISNQVVVR